jgi:hypothetical protein
MPMKKNWTFSRVSAGEEISCEQQGQTPALRRIAGAPDALGNLAQRPRPKARVDQERESAAGPDRSENEKQKSPCESKTESGRE